MIHNKPERANFGGFRHRGPAVDVSVLAGVDSGNTDVLSV